MKLCLKVILNLERNASQLHVQWKKIVFQRRSGSNKSNCMRQHQLNPNALLVHSWMAQVSKLKAPTLFVVYHKLAGDKWCERLPETYIRIQFAIALQKSKVWSHTHLHLGVNQKKSSKMWSLDLFLFTESFRLFAKNKTHVQLSKKLTQLEVKTKTSKQRQKANCRKSVCSE